MSQYLIGFPCKKFKVDSKSMLHCNIFHWLFVNNIQILVPYDTETEKNKILFIFLASSLYIW